MQDFVHQQDLKIRSCRTSQSAWTQETSPSRAPEYDVLNHALKQVGFMGLR